MDIERAAIIGAGTMGTGIAQVFLQNGFDVVLVDTSEEALDDAKEQIDAGLGKLVEKGVLSAYEADQMIEETIFTTAMGKIAGCDLVLEVVPEDIEVKGAVFRAAREHAEDALYATNTSSIPLSELAQFVPDAARFVGLHFFNPPPLIDLIEVVVTDQTSDETRSTAEWLANHLEKEHVVVKDAPGFVSNRILMPFINEAIRTLENDVADKEAIDTVATEGFNHPMGPLALADFIGLDVCLDILQTIYAKTQQEQFKPAPLLKRKVEKGETGRKSGKGFHTY